MSFFMVDAQGNEVSSFDALREMFNSGDDGVRSEAVLLAIDLAGSERVAIPAWAASYFSERFNKWHNLQVRTLGEAFSLPELSPEKFAKAQQKTKLFNTIYERVKAYQQAGTGIDWLEISEQIGYGKTECQNIYYARVKMLRTLGLDN